MLLLCVECARYVRKEDVALSHFDVEYAYNFGTTKGWDALRNCDFPDVKAVACKTCASRSDKEQCWECRESKMSYPAYVTDRTITVMVKNGPENQVVPLLKGDITNRVWDIRFRQLQNVGACSRLVLELPQGIPSRVTLHVCKLRTRDVSYCRNIRLRLSAEHTVYGTTGRPVLPHFLRHYKLFSDPRAVQIQTLQRRAAILEPFARVLGTRKTALMSSALDDEPQIVCIKLTEDSTWGHTGWHVAETYRSEYRDSYIDFMSFSAEPDLPLYDARIASGTKWFKMQDLQKLWLKIDSIRKLIDRNWHAIHFRLWGPDGLMPKRGWRMISELIET